MSDACVFCRLVQDRSQVPYWLAESDRALAFLTIRPLRAGHSLVIPKVHAPDLAGLTPVDWDAMMALTARLVPLPRRKLGATGENLFVASGPGSEQGVSHLHVHVIPRSPDDGLRWNDWWEPKTDSPPVTRLVELAQRIRS